MAAAGRAGIGDGAGWIDFFKESELSNQIFMVFDVESIGLHGEGFAVGYCVVDREKSLEFGFASCNPAVCEGDRAGREWIAQNVPPFQITHGTPEAMRSWFWSRWLFWKEKGAVLVADCAWPVEARFLAACVDDDRAKRTWEGPYPLHDLATYLLAAGRDPLAVTEREPIELPAHDPLNDARQSARQLMGLLNGRTN